MNVGGTGEGGKTPHDKNDKNANLLKSETTTSSDIFGNSRNNAAEGSVTMSNKLLKESTDAKTSEDLIEEQKAGEPPEEKVDHDVAAAALPPAAAASKLIKGPAGRTRTWLPPDFSPGPHDVICGRGRIVQNHPGNIQFRQLVNEHLDTYESNCQSKHAKSTLIASIVYQVRQKCQGADGGVADVVKGGFVKFDTQANRWYEVGDFCAREKTSQAFRNVIELYKSSMESKRHKRRLLQQQQLEEGVPATAAAGKKRARSSSNATSDLAAPPPSVTGIPESLASTIFSKDEEGASEQEAQQPGEACLPERGSKSSGAVARVEFPIGGQQLAIGRPPPADSTLERQLAQLQQRQRLQQLLVQQQQRDFQLPLFAGSEQGAKQGDLFAAEAKHEEGKEASTDVGVNTATAPLHLQPVLPSQQQFRTSLLTGPVSMSERGSAGTSSSQSFVGSFRPLAPGQSLLAPNPPPPGAMQQEVNFASAPPARGGGGVVAFSSCSNSSAENSTGSNNAGAAGDLEKADVKPHQGKSSTKPPSPIYVFSQQEAKRGENESPESKKCAGDELLEDSNGMALVSEQERHQQRGLQAQLLQDEAASGAASTIHSIKDILDKMAASRRQQQPDQLLEMNSAEAHHQLGVGSSCLPRGHGLQGSSEGVLHPAGFPPDPSLPASWPGAVPHPHGGAAGLRYPTMHSQLHPKLASTFGQKPQQQVSTHGTGLNWSLSALASPTTIEQALDCQNAMLSPVAAQGQQQQATLSKAEGMQATSDQPRLPGTSFLAGAETEGQDRDAATVQRLMSVFGEGAPSEESNSDDEPGDQAGNSKNESSGQRIQDEVGATKRTKSKKQILMLLLEPNPI